MQQRVKIVLTKAQQTVEARYILLFLWMSEPTDFIFGRFHFAFCGSAILILEQQNFNSLSAFTEESYNRPHPRHRLETQRSHQ